MTPPANVHQNGSKKKIVVLGAGVSGLTSALLLLRTGEYDISILAKHWPGDENIEYTSPWAGANWSSGAAHKIDKRWDKRTLEVLYHLAETQPDAGIEIRPCQDYWEDVLYEKKEDFWFADAVRNFKIISKKDLPSNVQCGVTFDTVCINTPHYLKWLETECTKMGASTLTRDVVAVSDAFKIVPGADIVVNCTGIGMAKLGDDKVFPTRGQTILIRNYHHGTITKQGKNITYIIPRPQGGTILGGCAQEGNWYSSTLEKDLANNEGAQRLMRKLQTAYKNGCSVLFPLFTLSI